MMAQHGEIAADPLLDPAVVEIDFLGCKFRSHLTIPLTLGELLDALRA